MLPAMADLLGPSGTLVELAPELLELILSYLGPHDLLSFARTCHRANDFIRPNNQILWKSAFLHVFDNPKHVWESLTPTARAANRPCESGWDWHRQLRRRCVACHVVCKPDHDLLQTNIEATVKALVEIEDTASLTSMDEHGQPGSLNQEFLDRLRELAPNFDALVHDYHRDLDSAALPLELLIDPDRPITRSMLGRRMAVPEWASRFHIIYGPTYREEESIRSKAAARALVYDWSVTGPAAEFGPFNKDNTGIVNWQAVEAISSLMHRIFATALKMYRLKPSGFAINIPNALRSNPEAPEDWAGVTGTWLGTYAFLDYRALVHYNFAHNMEYPLDLGGYDEACGDLMRLKLKLDDSEELMQDPRLQTNLPYCKDLPILFFNGTSNNQHTGRPSIGVRGSACLVPGGRQVRWRLIIRYAGADQWQLEGVQPAGIRSGGIYGLWSHVDHDDHGPMGPFYYAPSALCQTQAVWEENDDIDDEEYEDEDEDEDEESD